MTPSLNGVIGNFKTSYVSLETGCDAMSRVENFKDAIWVEHLFTL